MHTNSPKQKDNTGTTSTGWETFLDATISAGFGITGTWPMRTELSNRMLGMGTNALASSVVLVCRIRPASALNCNDGEIWLEHCAMNYRRPFGYYRQAI